jgi:ABC-type amino acid transport substrate-binding protein
MEARHKAGLSVAIVVVLVTHFLLIRTASAQPSPSQALPVRVVVKTFVPFVITDHGDVRGFSIDLLREISARAGFSYEIQEVATVQAQLDAVEAGRADMAVAGISITSEREKHVDFSQPIYNSGLQILVLETGSQSTLRKFMNVLSSPGLRQLIGFLVIVILAVAHVVWLVERRRNPDFPKGYVRGIWEGCWWAAVTMATVGYGDKPPTSIVGRMLAIFWMFAAIIIVANLTASISSSLTVRELQGTINSPSDLLGKRVATVRGTTSAQYLSSMQLTPVEEDKIVDAYWQLENRYVDAVVFDAPVLRNYAHTDGQGKVRVVGPVFQPQDYGIAIKEGSLLTEIVNRSLLKIKEDGTYRQIYERWFGPVE